MRPVSTRMHAAPARGRASRYLMAPVMPARSLLVLAVLCLCLAGPARLGAADFSVVMSLFLPSEYYVGDEVELRITLRTPFASTLVVPKTMPETSWGKIHSITIIKDLEEPEVRIRFTSFSPGIRTLPPVILGPVVLEGINVFVSSILKEGISELSPPRDPMLLPGTVILLLIQCLVFLSLPVGIWFFLSRGKPFLLLLWGRYHEGLPYRRVTRSLALLQAGMEGMDARTFYIRVLEETRMYLSDRLRIPALSATTSELDQTLRQRIHSPDAVTYVVQLFRHGDLVKFAKENASVVVRMNELHQLENSLRHIEQEEKMRRRALEAQPEAKMEAARVDL